MGREWGGSGKGVGRKWGGSGEGEGEHLPRDSQDNTSPIWLVWQLNINRQLTAGNVGKTPYTLDLLFSTWVGVALAKAAVGGVQTLKHVQHLLFQRSKEERE